MNDFPLADHLVRPANLADVSAMAAIHVETWRAAYVGLISETILAGLSRERHERMWRSAIAVHPDNILLCTHTSRITGFVSFGPCRDADGAGWAEIYAILVSKAINRCSKSHGLRRSRLRNDLHDQRIHSFFVALRSRREPN